MVHSFKYNHKGRDYHFLFDVETASLHNIDKDAYLVAKDKFGELSESEMIELDGMDKSLVAEISAELDQLEDEGSVNTANYSCTGDKQIGEIKALCLHICHDCNLRCKYCFADEGTYHSKLREYMSFEVGQKAIDFIVANSGKRHSLEVDFFGGEPLMNLDVVKQIVEYAKAQAVIHNKQFNFTMTTNCVLLTDENINWLNEEMFNVVLSIDGRECVHDKLRRTINGKGSQSLVLANAKKFRDVRGDKSYYVRGTFTSNNLDFASDVLYLRDQGFDQISVEPVVLPEDSPMALRAEHLPQIMLEYERLASEYLDSRSSGKWFNF